MAKFYGIGTGPGDPSLLTVKAVKTLEKLDILYCPEAKKGGESLALSIVKEYLKPTTLIKQRHFPMVSCIETKENAWKEIAEEISADVLEGKQVGFVTLGDPMIYSTYIYLVERLDARVEFVTIPGISSFANIASNQNIPLVVDDKELIIVPCTIAKEKIDYALKNYSSLVLMKVYKNFKDIFDLIESNKLKDKAIMVSNSSQDGERVYRKLKDIDLQDKVSYFSTIIINKEFEF